MTKFKQGNVVRVNTKFVEQNLSRRKPSSLLSQALERLGELNWEDCCILEVGKVINPDTSVLFFIRLVPFTKTNPAYNGGQGVIVYFLNQSDVDDCFIVKEEQVVLFDRSGVIFPLERTTATPKRKAIFTVINNGNKFLRIWYDYYRKYFPLHDIYIIDVHTTDGSLDGLECQIIKHPLNSAGFNVPTGNKLVNEYKSQLLKTYDYVIFVDYDEILFHPLGLDKFIDSLKEPYVTASGFEIIQKRNLEMPLDFNKTVLSQRSYWTRNPLYDKSSITSIDFYWEMGCHTIRDKAPIPDHNLYLLHLNKMDYLFLEQLHQRLHDVGSILGGGHHLLGKELSDWFFLIEKDAVPIPVWIKNLNFV